MLLVAGALWAWARERPLLTGALIGLGVAAKLYPLFLLGAVLVVCLRRRAWSDLAGASLAALVAWLALNLPAVWSSRSSWEVFWSFNSERGPDLGSLWLVWDQVTGSATSADVVNRVSLVLFALWCVGVLVVGLRAPSEPRLAQLAFLVVAGFLLVNKVYSPQYVLWLLRWPSSRARAGATCWCGSAGRSSTSPASGGTSRARSRRAAAATARSTGWRSCCGWPRSCGWSRSWSATSCARSATRWGARVSRG